MDISPKLAQLLQSVETVLETTINGIALVIGNFDAVTAQGNLELGTQVVPLQ